MSSDAQITPVVFLTGHYRIKGKIGMMAGVRLTDYMNETKDFIAVTEAVVYDCSSGEQILAGGFVNVQRSSIEVIIHEEK
jgi:Family of unknown function (DUF6812)